MRDAATDTCTDPYAGATEGDLAPRVALASGDGVGPEIADAVIAVLEAAGARIDLEEVDLRGNGDIPDTAVIDRAGVLLKGPMARGTAGLRRALGLHCTLRRARSFDPVLPAAHPGMDVVVIRETEEDLPGGPEHLQTADVAHCVKRITRPGTERLCRIAFGYAAASGRRRITCVTKANAMPITDGLFRRIFDETAAAHPEVGADAMLIDTAAAQLAARPERFDTLLAPNLYGDILSDVAAALAGLPQLATAVRFGTVATVFEPIHGPAERLVGRGTANPSAMLLSACELLGHLGQTGVAERVENAWARTLEDGMLPADLQSIGGSRRRLGTRAFANAVVSRLGERPTRMRAARPFAMRRAAEPNVPANPAADARRSLSGIDLTIAWQGREADVLLARLERLDVDGLTLSQISNGSHSIWPVRTAPGLVTAQWRCRFLGQDAGGDGPVADASHIAKLLGRVAAAGLEILKTESLYSYGGRPGFGPA